MVIGVDSNETPHVTIPDARVSENLEELSGADFIISPLQIPFHTEFLIKKHLDAGALLVQRKSGADLPASITYRLYKSLAKMRKLGARQWQCVLLTTGIFLPNVKTGKVVTVTPHFNEHTGQITYVPSEFSPVDYYSLQSSVRHWTWYGGVVLNVCEEELIHWCKTAESRLIRKLNEGETKEIWPDGPAEFYDPPRDGDPLQIPVLVTDWRAKFVIIVDGVGAALATALRNYMLEHGMKDTLWDAMTFAMSEDVTKVPGWGKAKMLAARKAMEVEGD